MKMVGYLQQVKGWLTGEPGSFYNYILGKDGLYIRAENPLIRATICIAPCEVRGLEKVEEEVLIKPGSVPRILYELALSVLYAKPDLEQYLAVTWDGAKYHLSRPAQEGSGGHVRYECPPSTIVDIHSHAAMPAFFSGTDNRDEQGLRIYMVIGCLNTLAPEFSLRLGVYGYFRGLDFNEVFV